MKDYENIKEDYKIIQVNDFCGGYTIVEGVNNNRSKIVQPNETPEKAVEFLGGVCVSFEDK